MNTEFQAEASSEITIRDVLVFLRGHFWRAAIGGCAGLLVAVILVLVLPARYTAEITVLPESPSALGGESGGLAGRLSGGLGGLASLAGISLNGMNSFKAEAVATLGSRVLTNEFIQKENLLPVLFSSDWDSTTKTWKHPKRPPDLWRADRLFEKHIRVIKTDQKTGLVVMMITWRDPRISAQWANGLVALTNDYMRQRTIAEAERNISYLNDEIAKTSVVAVKDEIYSLMEEEIRNEMVANGAREFALKVIDPALPPDKPSFPKPIVWIPLGLLGGLFLGYLWCVTRELSKEPL